MKNTNNPTLEDVAKEAGVSTATISRTLNEPHKVAKVTLDRIQAVVDRLGYTPNFGGKVLASKRSNTVGAIIPTMANSMFAGGLQAFQEELSEAGIRLLVASSGYDSKDELRQIRSLVTHGADGLLLIGSSRPAETLEFLTIRKIPHVISWCFQADKSHIYSGFDNMKAAMRLAEKVLQLGHKRIAMIAGVSAGNDRVSNRMAGVQQAVANFGRGAKLIAMVEAGYTMHDGAEAFAKIMSANVAPTAVICGNDVLAAGAIVKAKQLGITIPSQVSVTGFDDIDLASAVSPALTTVRVPQLEMGKTAAELLLQLLAKDVQVLSREFTTEIIDRESLAQAPQS